MIDIRIQETTEASPLVEKQTVGLVGAHWGSLGGGLCRNWVVVRGLNMAEFKFLASLRLGATW